MPSHHPSCHLIFIIITIIITVKSGGKRPLFLVFGPGQAVAPPENKYSNNSDVDRPIHGQSESLGKNISSFLSGRPVCLVLQKFTSGLSLSL
jgi:hypothetical protein